MDRRIFLYSIMASLLASLIFACIGPATVWLWDYASASTNSWITGIQDAAFKNAALGKRDWVSAIQFMFSGAFVFGVVTGVLMIAWFHRGLSRLTKEGVGGALRKEWLRRTVLVVITLFTLNMMLSWTKMIFFVYTDLQLNASFSQRIDALSPYMSIDDERRFRSKWALMKERHDFDVINSELEERAAKAGIALPVPLYK